MTPNPIRKVLSTLSMHEVRALLMGGQACVLYGAAEFSRDTDVVILADPENLRRLESALNSLQADVIAVPPLSQDYLDRGHAVHFRCRAPDVEAMRLDVMSVLRGLSDFETLWKRRTTLMLDGDKVEALSLPDLVRAKKTQRDKDWPMIGALVEGHYKAEGNAPTATRIKFWLSEARTPERLVELTSRFPEETSRLEAVRPLLTLARNGNLQELRAALDAEVRVEQEKDRVYWEPLKREMEEFRRAERENGEAGSSAV